MNSDSFVLFYYNANKSSFKRSTHILIMANQININKSQKPSKKIERKKKFVTRKLRKEKGTI